MAVNVTGELVEQIDWHWRHQLRARLEGLTDEEYFWEPVAGCWSVRRRSAAAPHPQPGSGEWTVDWAWPTPDPAPVTTIAWRFAHVLVGVLGARIAAHFGGEAHDYATYAYPGTAVEALRRLDDLYARWIAGVSAWSDADLAVAVGDAEPPEFAHLPRATLVLHINRELIHHGAEIALLRDLYAHRAAAPQA